MTINTKFELNEAVCFFDWRGNLQCGTIQRMTFDKKGLAYWLYVPGIPSPGFYENKLFRTEAEALAAHSFDGPTKYYIVSLYHTSLKDNHISLWGPDNAGYVWAKESAGLYADVMPGYHISERNMPITQAQAEPLFQLVTSEGQQKEMIPNRPEVWEALGLKIDKKENSLVRQKPKK